ncbi:MAG: carboxymuconolactone decarboxylase family protein [Armatimonadota bacterium]
MSTRIDPEAVSRRENPIATLQCSVGDLRLHLPEVVSLWESSVAAAVRPGKALGSRERHLIAFAIAVIRQSDDSVKERMADALAAGVLPGEIVECVGVTALLGGDSAVTYAARVLSFLETASVSEQLTLACLHHAAAPHGTGVDQGGKP